MTKSIVDLQGDPKTIRTIEEILKRLEANNTTEGFFVSLMQNNDEVVACVIGLKKEVSELVTRVTVLETKQSIISGAASKIGLIILGGIFTSMLGIGVWLIKNSP